MMNTTYAGQPQIEQAHLSWSSGDGLVSFALLIPDDGSVVADFLPSTAPEVALSYVALTAGLRTAASLGVMSIEVNGPADMLAEIQNKAKVPPVLEPYRLAAASALSSFQAVQFHAV